MQVKKSTIMISGISVAAFAIFLGLQLTDSKTLVKKTHEENELGASPSMAVPHDDQPSSPGNPQLERLNSMQKDVAAMANEDILQEIARLSASVHKSGLIKQNPEEFDLEKHPAAKEVLMRLALLRIERAKRGIDNKEVKN
jgi:hypothetical protein